MTSVGVTFIVFGVLIFLTNVLMGVAFYQIGQLSLTVHKLELESQSDLVQIKRLQQWSNGVERRLTELGKPPF